MIGGGMNRQRTAFWRHEGCCSECGRKTDWTCPECAMYAGVKVWLCPVAACRASHHATVCSVVAKAAN